MAFSQSSVRYCLILLLLGSGLGFAQQKNPVEEVFSLIEAKTVGQKTQALLHPATQERLKNYADSVLSKTLIYGTKNPLYVDNPDLHRMLCFLITSYVYASEAQNLPSETQVYVVEDGGTKRNQLLSLEIQNVQSIFDRCEKLELKLLPTGVVYFNWDTEDYLNRVSSEDRTMVAEVPEAFRKDPLLAQLFEAEARYSRVQRAPAGTLGNEPVMVLLEGVKNQIASGQPNLVKLATRVVSKAGQKALKKGLKERQALIASLTRDDASLFGSSAVQKETARALTRLVALPGQTSVSQESFANTLTEILGSDLKLKVKVGRESIYAGFKIELK